ncbi:MAG: fructose 1,6-bisphosphatase [Planctomycetes bacterium]|nr:fructose 1,6-bisphosphatase [Planctomycetota bacterium]
MDKMTLSCIKADIGSVGGHITPSEGLVAAVFDFMEEHAGEVVTSWDVNCIGDDISLLMVHSHGENSEAVHRLALNCLNHGANHARAEGLYGAGQDLDESAFSGNVKGMGPAVAEIEFEPRSAEAFILFAADKTDAGCYNLPLYLGFADPMHAPALILAGSMAEGFTFRIIDVENTEPRSIIDLKAPSELYEIAALLRDNSRYHIESIFNTKTGAQAVRTSADKCHIKGGKMKGKDDPIMICRVQGDFPSTGEVIAPYRLGHFTGGAGRGSHNTPLIPMRVGEIISFFDGPASVMAKAYSVSKDGMLTEGIDLFDNPVWDCVREDHTRKFFMMRDQGFSGPAMLNIRDLEYGGVAKRISALQERFSKG